jgi:hypothetical protein
MLALGLYVISRIGALRTSTYYSCSNYPGSFAGRNFPREAEAEKVWVPLADIDPLFDIV